jgi:hypothetical protein
MMNMTVQQSESKVFGKTDVEIYKDSVKRAPSQRETILNKLREAGVNGVLNLELVDICIGYRSRIAELYQMGYKIDCDNVEKGAVIYTLRSEPATPITNVPTAISVLTNEINDRGGIIDTEDLIELLGDLNFNVVRKHGSHKKSKAKVS